MDLRAALGVLGIDRDADWDAIRRAHRAAIVRTHPDRGGSANEAAEVNQALEVLRAATSDGVTPLPGPPPPPAHADVRPASRVPLRDPVEVLMRLADAAHDIGEVVFVDPSAGLLEVIVGTEPGVGQLTASVDTPDRGGVPVAFTLEPLGVAPAPPIAEVVASLMRRVDAIAQPTDD